MMNNFGDGIMVSEMFLLFSGFLFEEGFTTNYVPNTTEAEVAEDAYYEKAILK